MNGRWPGPVVALLLALCAGPARAGLTQQQIDSAVAQPQIGARMPLDPRFATRTGETRSLRQAIDDRPTLLVFADLTCTTLCGVTLNTTAQALEAMPRKPGRDYSFVVASIDPKDGAADAARMADAQLGKGEIGRAAIFLMGPGVDRLAKVAGFSYVYDSENDVYAHPVGLYVLSRAGRVVRYLPGLRVSPADVTSALDDAGAGKTTPVASPLLLLCYSYDPVTGVYTPAVTRIMSVAGVAMALFIAAGVGFLIRRERCNAPEGGGGRADG